MSLQLSDALKKLERRGIDINDPKFYDIIATYRGIGPEVITILRSAKYPVPYFKETKKELYSVVEYYEDRIERLFDEIESVKLKLHAAKQRYYKEVDFINECKTPC